MLWRFGFVPIYNAVGAVNFAYGEVVMFGGYFGYLAVTLLGLPLGLAFIFSLLAMTWLGIVNNYFAYYPMRHRPVVVVISTSIGMSVLLRNCALAIWGPDALRVNSFVGDGILNIGILIPQHNVLIILVTAFMQTQNLNTPFCKRG